MQRPSSHRSASSLRGILAGLLLLLSGCLTSPEAPPSRQRLRVVATYSILGDWVRTIGGNQVEVVTLVGPGGDAHTYEPTPTDSVSLAQAKLLFENGLGFETWLDDLIASSQSGAKRIVVTQGLPLRTMSHSEGASEVDPHVWHTPHNAIVMVRAVTQALIAADPQNTREFQGRADRYVAALESLDASIRTSIATLPPERRQLFTTHDTFGYFAEEYRFQVHSIMGSMSSEVADPSAADMAQTIELIRQQRVPAVFAENIINPQLTEQVAREAGVKVVPSLYTDALGPPDSAGGTYLQMMQFNVQTIVEALR